MVSEEDEVSLVVEGDHSPAGELGDLGEPGGQQSPHAVTQSSREVVQNHLWSVLRDLPVTLQPRKPPMKSQSHDHHVSIT